MTSESFDIKLFLANTIAPLKTNKKKIIIQETPQIPQVSI